MAEVRKERFAPLTAPYVCRGVVPPTLPNGVLEAEGGGPPDAHATTHAAAGSDPVTGILNSQVAAGAAIVESKLSLNFPTHSNALDHTNTNDPTAGQKAALPGTSGTPGAGNLYVTDADARNTNSRAPTSHGDSLHDATVASLDGGGKVPTAEMGTGTADATVFLRGDRSWVAAGGGGPHAASHVSGSTDPLTGILESQLTLNFATHSNANDPTAGEKAGLVGTSGAPGSGNKYVTDADARNTNSRAPTAHGDSLHDATVASLDGGGRVPTAELGSGAASATTYLRGDQTWATPAGGAGGSATNVTVNVPTAVMEASVPVADATVSLTSKVILGWGNVAQTDQNHPGMGEVAFNAIPGTGQFSVEVFSLDPSPVFGDFKLSYMVF